MMQPFRWKISIETVKKRDGWDHVLQTVQGLAKLADGLVILLSLGHCVSNVELTVTSYRMRRVFAKQQKPKS